MIKNIEHRVQTGTCRAGSHVAPQKFVCRGSSSENIHCKTKGTIKKETSVVRTPSTANQVDFKLFCGEFFV